MYASGSIEGPELFGHCEKTRCLSDSVEKFLISSSIVNVPITTFRSDCASHSIVIVASFAVVSFSTLILVIMPTFLLKTMIDFGC